MSTFKRLIETSPDAWNLRIHVAARVPTDELDEGDLDDAGNCTVDGTYRIGVVIPEGEASNLAAIALELFHTLCPIYKRDDFGFFVSTANANMDGTPRQDLGDWHCLRSAPYEETRINQGLIEVDPDLKRLGFGT